MLPCSEATALVDERIASLLPACQPLAEQARCHQVIKLPEPPIENIDQKF
jgi:hypothetical protein